MTRCSFYSASKGLEAQPHTDFQKERNNSPEAGFINYEFLVAQEFQDDNARSSNDHGRMLMQKT